MLKAISSITNAIGALNFKGTWNANTNTPTIVSGVGVKGDYFVVGVAGSTTIDGISNWGVGDWIAYNGSVWQRVEGGADLNGVNLSVSGTTTLSNLTASTALALNASKEIVSVTNTGTGDNVLANSPSFITPNLGDATATKINTSEASTGTIANTATATIFTLPAVGSYLVVVRQDGAGNGGIRASAIVAQGSSSNGTSAIAGVSCTLSSGSGFGVNLTNNAGGDAVFRYSFTRLSS